MKFVMGKEHEKEWNEAQNIVLSEDLFAVAKRQLQFLAAVDQNRSLYEGPALQKAIYRYNACWLPLLARHSEAEVSKGPLVVPLDCEWVWHCHRLNPLRYKSDCEELYGRILDNKNVVSSLQGISKEQTEAIWNKLYPEEPYDLDLTKAFSNDISESLHGAEKHTKYDLVSAVERQSPFFSKVSRPHMNNDLFLEEAVARYQGFLHLIRRNRKMSLNRFCVPTLDIDLIWHSHQLNPVSYCNDLARIVGKVVGHDDTETDKSKGSKLDTGLSETTKQWEETFGSRYWKAGAMNRKTASSPLTTTPLASNAVIKKTTSNGYEKIVDLPEMMMVEVLLECVEIRNLPEEYKGNVSVLISKTPQDAIFNVKRRLTISSESRQKQVALFDCQPTGCLFFELIFQAPSNLPISKPSKVLASSSSISLEEFQGPVSKLSVDRWLDLVPSSDSVGFQSVSLHVAASFTIPVRVPHELMMAHSAKKEVDANAQSANVVVAEGNLAVPVEGGGCGGCCSGQLCHTSFQKDVQSANVVVAEGNLAVPVEGGGCGGCCSGQLCHTSFQKDVQSANVVVAEGNLAVPVEGGGCGGCCSGQLCHTSFQKDVQSANVVVAEGNLAVPVEGGGCGGCCSGQLCHTSFQKDVQSANVVVAEGNLAVPVEGAGCGGCCSGQLCHTSFQAKADVAVKAN